MRLINTSTLQLVHFSGAKPDYAILSHTWAPDGEEVSYQEMTAANRLDTTTTKPGFRKIEQTCEIARKTFRLEYAWIDTCCIDKTSSAELSEAINSMFKWYQEAEICLAFLADVDDNEESFTNSKWFTRGWTLQELIAPQVLIFFDLTWTIIESKSQLLERISEITGIEASVLQGSRSLDQVPVAARMSWASTRQTTREEDMAYCLMGIFDINMPMLYGEGAKSFLRLQEEIIKQSPGMSIFAWTRPDPIITYEYESHAGILASSPKDFAQVRDITPNWTRIQIPEFSVSNRGLKFDVQLGWGAKNGLCILPLGHGTRYEDHIGVYLRQVEDYFFVRANTGELVPAPDFGTTRKRAFNVAKSLTDSQSIAMQSDALRFERSGLIWSQHGSAEVDYKIERVRPRGIWSPEERVLYIGPSPVSICFIHLVPMAPSPELGFVVSCSLLNALWRFELLPASSWPASDRDVTELYQRLGKNDGSSIQSLHISPQFSSSLHRLISLSTQRTVNRDDKWCHTYLRLQIHNLRSYEPILEEAAIQTDS